MKNWSFIKRISMFGAALFFVCFSFEAFARDGDMFDEEIYSLLISKHDSSLRSNSAIHEYAEWRSGIAADAVAYLENLASGRDVKEGEIGLAIFTSKIGASRRDLDLVRDGYLDESIAVLAKLKGGKSNLIGATSESSLLANLIKLKPEGDYRNLTDSQITEEAAKSDVPLKARELKLVNAAILLSPIHEEPLVIGDGSIMTPRDAFYVKPFAFTEKGGASDFALAQNSAINHMWGFLNNDYAFVLGQRLKAFEQIDISSYALTSFDIFHQEVRDVLKQMRDQITDQVIDKATGKKIAGAERKITKEMEIIFENLETKLVIFNRKMKSIQRSQSYYSYGQKRDKSDNPTHDLYGEQDQAYAVWLLIEDAARPNFEIASKACDEAVENNLGKKTSKLGVAYCTTAISLGNFENNYGNMGYLFFLRGVLLSRLGENRLAFFDINRSARYDPKDESTLKFRKILVDYLRDFE